MPALRSPEDLLAVELKGIRSAEQQLSRVLPRLMKKTSSDRLKEMLEQRREQGAELMDEIDEALEELQLSKGRAKNLAAEGLIEDINMHLEEADDERLADPLLIGAMQKVEHYCIAAWGTAKALGTLLEREGVVRTMERVLEEGKAFDQEMTKLAEEEVNPRMLEDGEAEEKEGEESSSSGSRTGKRRAKSRR